MEPVKITRFKGKRLKWPSYLADVAENPDRYYGNTTFRHMAYDKNIIYRAMDAAAQRWRWVSEDGE